MDVKLSVVIPSYNEALRLPPFLAAVHEYLETQYRQSYEVIVVDDGSADGLADDLQRRAADWPNLIVLRHPTNRGKGAAVRTGMLAARGCRLLFADADGAGPIDQEARLSEAIGRGADVAVGSRLAGDANATRQRTWLRGLLGWVFAGFARRWLRIPVRDTQCGFKMFRREAAKQLFSRSCEPGYLFDLELLVLARQLGYHIEEVPIDWKDVPGGHLSPLRELGRILLGLWRLRRRLLGRASPMPQR